MSRVGPKAVVLLIAASGLLAQELRWNYRSTADLMTDLRNDAVWTDAVVPAGSAYQLGVTCEDTEYISVLVRSDAAIAPAG